MLVKNAISHAYNVIFWLLNVFHVSNLIFYLITNAIKLAFCLILLLIDCVPYVQLFVKLVHWINLTNALRVKQIIFYYRQLVIKLVQLLVSKVAIIVCFAPLVATSALILLQLVFLALLDYIWVVHLVYPLVQKIPKYFISINHSASNALLNALNVYRVQYNVLVVFLWLIFGILQL